MQQLRPNLILLCLLFPVFLYGQFFNAGFRAGVNSNQFVTQGIHFHPEDAQLGFAGGMFLRFKAGPFSFQPEAILSHKNGMFSYSTVNEGVDTFFQASLQNLDIPLILNLHLGRHLRFCSGPVVSYPVGEKVTFTSNTQSYHIIVDKDVFKQTAYSWQFGAAFEFRRLFLDVRYELGIDKLNYALDLSNPSLSLDPEIHNRTWQFTLGYKLVKRK